MKKLILAVAAVSTFGAGAAFAQANVVGNGMPDPVPAEVAPHDVYGNSGWTPEQAYGVPSYRSRGVYALPDGRLVVPQAYSNNNNYVYRPYASRGRIGDIDGDGVRDRRDTDRDGDGVRNERDRYPDDYRYR